MVSKMVVEKALIIIPCEFIDRHALRPIVRIMVLITFLSKLVVARKPYFTQTLGVTLNQTIETDASLLLL